MAKNDHRTNNTNAAKYTYDQVRARFKSILDEARREYGDLDYLGEPDNRLPCYTLLDAYHANGVTEDWVLWQIKRWKTDVVLRSIKKAAKNHIKARIIRDSLAGRIPKQGAAMAIFVLKNNHDMADHVEHKVAADVTVRSKMKWGDNEISF